MMEEPLLLDALSPTIRKYVETTSPIPLRLTAAKGGLPLAPADFVTVLFLLSVDLIPEIREAAQLSARHISEKFMVSVGRDERLKTEVLDWLMDLHWANTSYAKLLVSNASTSDEAIARCASHCSAQVLELIGLNQLRLLRHEEILRQICQNPNATPVLVDSVCEFAVRNGIFLEDIAAMQEAKGRVFGRVTPEKGPTVAQLVGEFESIEDEKALPLEEGKRLSLSQKVLKMSVSEKIKLAMRGNKEIRTLLLRDTNRLVAVAAVQSPRMTEAEILGIAQNRTTPEEILRIVFRNKEWLKLYPIKLALTKNAKVPQAISMRLLPTLKEGDIKTLAKDRNVPNAIQTMAKKLAVSKKT
ncbi:MAG: hypothetical protein FWC28_08750 [Proteobacteria bacterium]|nr:hypothetical protein [Cystobacterineae bacterium]MCL2259481.1 hypothetical protein [Cystobacterineae bacterium]MCL2315318.1 hypothetical protein [Pseudomonadota bacterium]